ncbi:MAG: nickel pincer cofactor biosynthesis protein LarC, partial [Nitrospirota bacterium]|nr:nickel pincer cofactor biosynthesis protein LarC [Nitrospirota bacterium]
VVVEKTAQPHHRHLSDISAIIGASTLPDSVKSRSIAAFTRLAEAEAAVHGISVDEVHFHEVGAVDAIIDIVGGILGMEMLGVERVYASAVNLGSGTVTCEHGVLPVPAPATVELLKGWPVYSSDIKKELTTPTGALLLTALASASGPMPVMRMAATGYGAGGDMPGRPNCLRLIVGDTSSTEEQDEVMVLDTDIDDMNPQVYGYLIERLLEAGALDARLTPVYMKKGRPGITVTVLCEPGLQQKLEEIIFAETTTLGVRSWRASRSKLRRESKEVETPWGTVRVKLAFRADGQVTAQPEYDDCRRLAEEHGVPLRRVMEAAASAAGAQKETP